MSGEKRPPADPADVLLARAVLAKARLHHARPVCALCLRPFITGTLVELLRDGREAHPECANEDRP